MDNDSSGSNTPTTPVSTADLADIPLVRTKYGEVEGLRVAIEMSDEGEVEEVDLFLGLPYALPPVGERRFERPLPPEPWEGVLQAKSYGDASIPLSFTGNKTENGKTKQKAVRVSEDCLTLNIFRPSIPTPDPNGYPVLVYIHGGGFCSGSAREYGYLQLCKNFVLRPRHSLILVTIQYRLAALGFLTDGSDDFAGNYALWDQAMALRYLHQTIQSFGGDPNRITAWGLSAGAASISALSLSPYCRESIFATIEMSGTVLAAWGCHERVVEVSKKVLDELANGGQENDDKAKHNGVLNGHSKKSSKEVAKRSSVEQIQAAVHKHGTSLYAVNLLKYQPRVDGKFFPKDIPALVDESRPRPCLMGLTASEALYFTILGKDRVFNRLHIDRANFHSFDSSRFRQIVEEIVAPAHKFQSVAHGRKAQAEICDFYLGEALTKVKREDQWRMCLEKYTELIGDLLFNVSIVWMARRRAKNKWPTYLYYNQYFNPGQFPDWAPLQASTHANEYPNMHGLFPVGRFNFNDSDHRHRSLILQLIASFASGGVPSLEGLDAGGGDWPCVPDQEEKELIFLKIDTHSNLQFGRVLSIERSVRFWTDFHQKYGYDPVRELPSTCRT